jgi:hypothetical protein
MSIPTSILFSNWRSIVVVRNLETAKPALVVKLKYLQVIRDKAFAMLVTISVVSRD